MQRERCRVDRNSHVYSVAVFTVDARKVTGPSAAQIAEVLVQRMRGTDEAGWFDDDHLAVILDDTGPTGAWKFCQDVSGLIEKKCGLKPECRVYAYSSLPNSNDRDANGPGGLRRHNDSDDRPQTGGPEDHPRMVNDRDRQPAAQPEPVGVSRECRTEPSCPPVENLTPYLVPRIARIKRLMDVSIAGIMLVLLTPLFLAVAALIKIVSRGPVFFRQERIGFMGRPFRMWKFRTMKVNADSSAHRRYLAELIQSDASPDDRSGKAMRKIANDPRIIPLGNLLRKCCIDELPQLFNVLKGQMSLIGPRPPIPYEVEEYQHWHRGRFDTIPGMTGLWQVNGKNRTTFKQMVRYDITYARHMSLWMDVKILAGTIPAIVSQIKQP